MCFLHTQLAQSCQSCLTPQSPFLLGGKSKLIKFCNSGRHSGCLLVHRTVLTLGIGKERKKQEKLDASQSSLQSGMPCKVHQIPEMSPLDFPL